MGWRQTAARHSWWPGCWPASRRCGAAASRRVAADRGGEVRGEHGGGDGGGEEEETEEETEEEEDDEDEDEGRELLYIFQSVCN